MPNRLQMHDIFCSILGTTNAYFQPPESIKIQYPAIIYNLDSIGNAFADNSVYKSQKRYSVFVVDSDPDSLIIDKIAGLPTCRFDRHYEKDNLNYDVFTIYF